MIYVDDMKAEFRGMKMCHMIADRPEQLREMARLLGLKMRWIQNRGSYREHFDICLTMRKKAVKLGAIEVTQLELGQMVLAKAQGYGFSVIAQEGLFPL